MRLLSVDFRGQSLVGKGTVNTVDLTRPDERWNGWRVSVRGPAVYLISPPGWSHGKPKHEWQGTEPRSFEVGRSTVTLNWEGAEVGQQSYDSPVIGPVQEPSEAELEAATRPEAKKKAG